MTTSPADVLGLQVTEMLAVAAAAPPPAPPPPPAPAPPPAPPMPAPPAAPPPPPRVETWTDATFSAAVLGEINGRRANAGLAPLASDARLAQAASAYAMKMLRLSAFSHNADGTSFDARIRAAGFTENVALGEIIAMSAGGATPASIVQLWMDSPSHRSAILSGSYRLAGSGCAFAGAEMRCVVDFAE